MNVGSCFRYAVLARMFLKISMADRTYVFSFARMLTSIIVVCVVVCDASGGAGLRRRGASY